MLKAVGRPSCLPTYMKLHELAMAVVNNGSRNQAAKMFDLAIDLEEQVSRMMKELELIHETLAKLVALYPESLDSDGGW